MKYNIFIYERSNIFSPQESQLFFLVYRQNRKSCEISKYIESIFYNLWRYSAGMTKRDASKSVNEVGSNLVNVTHALTAGSTGISGEKYSISVNIIYILDICLKEVWRNIPSLTGNPGGKFSLKMSFIFAISGDAGEISSMQRNKLKLAHNEHIYVHKYLKILSKTLHTQYCINAFTR